MAGAGWHGAGCRLFGSHMGLPTPIGTPTRGADFDRDRIMGEKGTKLYIILNDRRGVGISSDYIGKRLPVQEAYGGQYSRLSEVSYE
ncbi:hypothetical protein ACFOKF_19110 [Sphingobium rhizovicinum]|uniref:Uncharacterized protein n=1 Tax=Sphingobium rhizovicinum TaxID=432308 RepID=A0ABV7NLR6_9SPHN